MQTYNQPPGADYGAAYIDRGQNRQNTNFVIPTQNRFAPISEWVGMSMGVDTNNAQMEWEMAQSKRKRYNTGLQDSFSALSVDDKLSNMFQKLENLERTNSSIESIARGMNATKVQVEHISRRADNHEQCLKVLAYKSIDLEARSRRNNLLFHGLAESKNENCIELLRNFLWNEMGIDLDDYYVERAHRLGSLYKARQRNQDRNPRRPIIVAFGQHSQTNIIIESAYMLKGTNFSVTRDYPIEIVTARRNLMPLYKEHRKNRNNRVSLEFPARLVVNGKTVADSFPDWYTVLQRDRYQMVHSLNIFTSQQSTQGIGGPQPQTENQFSSVAPLPSTQTTEQHVYQPTRAESPQPQLTRTYAQAASAVPQINTCPATQSTTQSTASVTVPSNVPRYTSVNAGNQSRNQIRNGTIDNSHHDDQCGSVNTTNFQGDNVIANGPPSFTQL